MKIIAIGNYHVIIQISDHKNRDYEQVTISHGKFEKFMETEFPKYWEEYKNSDSVHDAAKFFYNYGETVEMRIKGIAYTYEK